MAAALFLSSLQLIYCLFLHLLKNFAMYFICVLAFFLIVFCSDVEPYQYDAAPQHYKIQSGRMEEQQ
jgi:hypothetical protein